MIYNHNRHRVTIRHKPTGIVATCDMWPSVGKNRVVALHLLKQRVYAARHGFASPVDPVVREYDGEATDLYDVPPEKTEAMIAERIQRRAIDGDAVD